MRQELFDPLFNGAGREAKKRVTGGFSAYQIRNRCI